MNSTLIQNILNNNVKDALLLADEIVSDTYLNRDDLSFFWHPLGFCYCKLFEDTDWVIRIHVWPLNNTRPQSKNLLIHNHNFDLHSLIVRGQIKQIIHKVDESESAIDTDTWLMGVKYMPNKAQSTLYPIHSITQPELLSVKQFSRGNIYSMLTGEYHETEVSQNESTITIALTTAPNQLIPKVIGKSINNIISFDRIECDKNFILKVIKQSH